MRPPDLIRAYSPVVAPRQAEYVLDAVQRNELSHHGAYHGRFEKAVGEIAGRSHAVLTSSGTTALAALYHAAGLRGKRVLAPTLTYAATVNQLIVAGARPVLVDCGSTLQMDEVRVARALKAGEADAVVVAPLYGDCPVRGYIADHCRSRGVPLYVDAAEALGAVHGGQPVAKYGEGATFSHYSNKLLTTAEGGTVVTDDPELAARVRSHINHATTPGYHHTSPFATNARMTNLQAAVGLAQSESLGDTLASKARVLDYYAARLGPAVLWPSTGLAWMVVVRMRAGARYWGVAAHARERGVELRPVFPPMHTLPAFRPHVSLAGDGDLSVSESASERHLCLPSGPTLTEEELAKVVEVVGPFLVQ